MSETVAIQSVVVLPHSGSYSYFYINGLEEKHTKRLGELNEFLADLAPTLAGTIRKYVYDGIPFFLDIENVELAEIEEVPPPLINHRMSLFPKADILKEVESQFKKKKSSSSDSRFSIILKTKNAIYKRKI